MKSTDPRLATLRIALATLGVFYGERGRFVVNDDRDYIVDRVYTYDKIVDELLEGQILSQGKELLADSRDNFDSSYTVDQWLEFIAKDGFCYERVIYAKDLKDNLNNWPASPLDNIDHRKGFRDAMEVLINQYQLEDNNVPCGPSCSEWHNCADCIDPELITETKTEAMVLAEFEEEVCLKLNTVKDDYYYSFTNENYYLPVDATDTEKHMLMQYKKKTAGVEDIDAQELLDKVQVVYGEEHITVEFRIAVYSAVDAINNTFGMADFPMTESKLCVLLTSEISQEQQIEKMNAYYRKYKNRILLNAGN